MEEYAIVVFSDILCAFFAQQSLNNLYLNKQNVHLLVRWVPKELQQGLPVNPPPAAMQSAGGEPVDSTITNDF